MVWTAHTSTGNWRCAGYGPQSEPRLSGSVCSQRGCSGRLTATATAAWRSIYDLVTNPGPRDAFPLISGLPSARGLYQPGLEHDACGIGFVSQVQGKASHDIIVKGIQVLINLAHRGACGCDPETGDGAGVLIQIPHRFFVRECGRLGFTLPPAGEYGVGMTFLPVEPHHRRECEGILERIVREESLGVLGWRDTPIE